MNEVTTKCRCSLPLDLPSVDYWFPEMETEPGPETRAVAAWGCDPGYMRWELDEGHWITQGLGAAHPGTIVDGSWRRVGQCWAGTYHPVIDVTDWLNTMPEQRQES